MKIQSWLKKYFIPHEQNDHRPHFLRDETMRLVLATVLVIELGFLAQTLWLSQTGLFASILKNVVIEETNQGRGMEGFSSLKENPLLNAAAAMKAEDMAQKGYFAHISPEGADPWYWIAQAGYKYSYAGENLAINFVDSKDIVSAWLTSPAHRENIMNSHFTEIGIGTATGTYEGRETIFVVQMFGTPAVSQQPVTVLPKESLPSEPIEIAAISTATSEVLAATDVNVPATKTALPKVSAAIQEMVGSPQTTVFYFAIALLALIALALVLNIFIRTDIQHRDLITNGLIMLVIINAALFLNHYLALGNAQIF